MEYQVDATGLQCPEPVMMLHAAIRKVSLGDVVCLTATDPSTRRDVAKFCDFQMNCQSIIRMRRVPSSEKKAGSMSDRCFGESVIAVFNGVFRETDHTVLRGGAAEPFYEPGALGDPFS